MDAIPFVFSRFLSRSLSSKLSIHRVDPISSNFILILSNPSVVALKSRGQASAKMYQQSSMSSLRGLELVIPPGSKSPSDFQDPVARESVDRALPKEPPSRRASIYTTDSEDMTDPGDEKVEFNLFQPRGNASKTYSPEPSPMIMTYMNTEFPFPMLALVPGKSVHGSQLEPLEEERRLSRWERQPGDPATYFAEQYQSDLPAPLLSPNDLQEHDPREIVDRYLRLSMPLTPVTLQQPPQRLKPWNSRSSEKISPLTPRLTDFRNVTSHLSYPPEGPAPRSAQYNQIGHTDAGSSPRSRSRSPYYTPRSKTRQIHGENILKPSSSQDRDQRRWEIEHSLIPPPLAPRKSVVPFPLLPFAPIQAIHSERQSSFGARMRAPSASLGRALEYRASISTTAPSKASISHDRHSDHQVQQYACKKYPSMPQPQPNMSRKFSTYAMAKRNSISNTLTDMYDTLGRLSIAPRGSRPEPKTGGPVPDMTRKSREMRSPAIPITSYQRDGPAGWEKSEETSPTSGDDTTNLFTIGKKQLAWVKRWREERVEKSKERRRDELRGQIRVLGPAGEKHGVEFM